jgi:hypothetical protein
MKDDPIIAEIRRVRHKISAACGHDTKRLVEHYRNFEKKLRKSGKFRFSDEPKAAVATHDAK